MKQPDYSLNARDICNVSLQRSVNTWTLTFSRRRTFPCRDILIMRKIQCAETRINTMV